MGMPVSQCLNLEIVMTTESANPTPSVQVQTSLGVITVHRLNIGRLLKASAAITSETELTHIESFQRILPILCTKHDPDSCLDMSLRSNEVLLLTSNDLEGVAKAVADLADWNTQATNDLDSWVSLVITRIRSQLERLGRSFTEIPLNNIFSQKTKDLLMQSAGLSASLRKLATGGPTLSALQAAEAAMGATAAKSAMAALGPHFAGIAEAARPLQVRGEGRSLPQEHSLIKFPRPNESLEKLLIQNRAINEEIRDISQTSAASLATTNEAVVAAINDMANAREKDDQHKSLSFRVALISVFLSALFSAGQLYLSVFVDGPASAQQTTALMKILTTQQSELKKLTAELQLLHQPGKTPTKTDQSLTEAKP